MKSDKGMHNTRRNSVLLKELENPLARLTKNRNKLLANCIKKMYRETLGDILIDKLENIVADIQAMARKARLETEGEEDDLKEVLSREKQLELGYSVGNNRDIKKLRTLN